MALLPSQAAAQVGVSTKTLRDWTKRGKLRAERLPCGWSLYNEKDIARLKRELERRRIGADTEAR